MTFCFPMIRTTVFILPMLLAPTFSVHGATYKWVDDDGNTVYSQVPPLNGQAETIRIDRTNPDVLRQGREQLRQLLEKSSDLREDRKLAAEKSAEEEKRQAQVRDYCDSLGDNMAKLRSTRPNVQFRMPDGSYSRLTPEEQQERLKEYSADFDANCH